MTFQTENSTDSIDAVAYAEKYRQAMTHIGQAEDYVALYTNGVTKFGTENKLQKFDRELKDITSSLNRLRNYIESIDRLHNREIDILYRLIEERTLILSDVDEIYNDYC